MESDATWIDMNLTFPTNFWVRPVYWISWKSVLCGRMCI